MGRWGDGEMGGWVDGWMGGWGACASPLINLELLQLIKSMLLSIRRIKSFELSWGFFRQQRLDKLRFSAAFFRNLAVSTHPPISVKS